MPRAFWSRKALAVWCGATPREAPRSSLAKVEDDEVALGPQIFPGGDALLFTIGKASHGTGTRWDQARVVVQSLSTGERKTVLEGGSDARLVQHWPPVYAVGGIVFAAPFDLAIRELRGPRYPWSKGWGAASAGRFISPFPMRVAGLHARADRRPRRHSADWRFGDRSGTVTRLSVPRAAYSHVRVSHDGIRAAIGIDDGKQASVMIYALNGTQHDRSASTAEGKNRFPVWSPDGQLDRVPIRPRWRSRTFPAARGRHRRCRAADDGGGGRGACS